MDNFENLTRFKRKSQPGFFTENHPGTGGTGILLDLISMGSSSSSNLEAEKKSTSRCLGDDGLMGLIFVGFCWVFSKFSKTIPRLPKWRQYF